MSNNNNSQLWNPFIPTQRDIQRTDELASKNTIIAGVLTFLFFPAGLIYLKRGVNVLKIFGYVIALMVLTQIISGKKESLSNLVGLLGCSAMTAEQVLTIKKARQRQGGISNINPSIDMTEKVKIDDQAVTQLKDLKQRYEANEISEEEFLMRKQELLDSL